MLGTRDARAGQARGWSVATKQQKRQAEHRMPLTEPPSKSALRGELSGFLLSPGACEGVLALALVGCAGSVADSRSAAALGHPGGCWTAHVAPPSVDPSALSQPPPLPTPSSSAPSGLLPAASSRSREATMVANARTKASEPASSSASTKGCKAAYNASGVSGVPSMHPSLRKPCASAHARARNSIEDTFGPPWVREEGRVRMRARASFHSLSFTHSLNSLSLSRVLSLLPSTCLSPPCGCPRAIARVALPATPA
jgi:hypothetical protein